jgi:phosphoserine phosphatase RsbU/P
VGGDYYDFIELAGGLLGIAIGDVAGKGISAALMMSNLQASLRSQIMVGTEDLAGIVSRINRLIYQASSVERYATFFLAEYDPQSRTLSYVNAGHYPPVLLRRGTATAELKRLDIGGTVIGLIGDAQYEQGKIQLEPGDLLVSYTDGITEAINPAGDDWGEPALIDTIGKLRNLEAKEILKGVMSEANAFAAGAEQHDDMTLVVLRLLP